VSVDGVVEVDVLGRGASAPLPAPGAPGIPAPDGIGDEACEVSSGAGGSFLVVAAEGAAVSVVVDVVSVVFVLVVVRTVFVPPCG